MSKEKKEDTEKKFSLNLNFWLIVILAFALFGTLIGGFVISNSSNDLLDQKIAAAKEASRPANIDIIKIVDSSCLDCIDVSPVIDLIKKENVKVGEEITFEVNTQDGLGLAKKFNITKIPTFIISGEIEKEAALKELWPKIGEVKEGSFVYSLSGGPYVLLNTGAVIGRVKLTMISDKSCSECYEVSQHQSILGQFGLTTKDVESYDAASKKGKELIEKYKIELIPTIIISGDIEAYPTLKSIWSDVGTSEEDGSYVFREGVKKMGVYKNLTTDEIVKPTNNQ